jgi:hypothetical protein
MTMRSAPANFCFIQHMRYRRHLKRQRKLTPLGYFWSVPNTTDARRFVYVLEQTVNSQRGMSDSKDLGSI